MITDRFLQLKKEKKRMITQVIMEEVQSDNYREVNLKRIAKRAGISRGSLYTYFDGKKGLIQFAMDCVRTSAFEYNQKLLEKNQGNYWNMMEEGFRHHLCNMSDLLFCARSGPLDDVAKQQYEKWIFQNIDREKSGIANPEDLQYVEEICQALVATAVQRYRNGMISQADAETDFLNKLKWIRTKMAERNVLYG